MDSQVKFVKKMTKQLKDRMQKQKDFVEQEISNIEDPEMKTKINHFFQEAKAGRLDVDQFIKAING